MVLWRDVALLREAHAVRGNKLVLRQTLFSDMSQKEEMRLDWLEKLKSTRERERERERLFDAARDRWEDEISGFETKISTFFPFRVLFLHCSRSQFRVLFLMKKHAAAARQRLLSFFFSCANVRLFRSSTDDCVAVGATRKIQEKKRESQLLVKLSPKYRGDSRMREDKNNLLCHLRSILNCIYSEFQQKENLISRFFWYLNFVNGSEFWRTLRKLAKKDIVKFHA